MLVSLLCASFLLFFLLFFQIGSEWRWAFLHSATLWGGCVVFITETLSVPRLLGRIPVAVFWLVICLVAALCLAWRNQPLPKASQLGFTVFRQVDRAQKAFLVLAGLITTAVLLTALLAPPNTWDAMEYHLPRVILWMSSHTVRFFPTPDYCQLVYGAWAEYVMMHTELLWGSDRLVNLVEFFSMAGSLVGVSLIAKMLGAGLRGQVLAVIAGATIPSGILEASGPMNTYVASFWIITAVAFLIRWREDPGWLNTICIGLATGLALFTKGTSYIYFPFLAFACWWMAPAARRVGFLKRSAVMLVMILVVNGAHFYRCYQLTGSPLGLPLPRDYPRTDLSVARVSVRGTAANALRNISLHFGTPSDSLNLKIENMFRTAIQSIGADPDDPGANSFAAPFQVYQFSLYEVHGENPLHLLLLLFSMAVVIRKRGHDGSRLALLYAGGLTASFLLFCALIRWNIWLSRLQLPLFVLASALIGFVLERVCADKIQNVLAFGLLLFAVPFALCNHTRSLIPWSRVVDVYKPRDFLYFADQHEMLAPAHIAAAEAINRSGCEDIAVDSYLPNRSFTLSPKSLYVYPMFALIHAGTGSRRVRYVGVQNSSVRYADSQVHPAPCAVLCFDCEKSKAKWQEYDQWASHAAVYGNLVVFGLPGAPTTSEAPN